MSANGNQERVGRLFFLEIQRAIVDGVMQEAGGRSVEQLANEENELLVKLLRLRAHT